MINKRIKLKKVITIIKNLFDDIVGFRYDDEITAIDYETILFPAKEAALKRNKNLKVLCRVVDNFKYFKLGALKDDMEIGWKYLRDWKKIAFVSDNEWMNHAGKGFWFLVPAKVKTFDNRNMKEAIKWLKQ